MFTSSLRIKLSQCEHFTGRFVQTSWWPYTNGWHEQRTIHEVLHSLSVLLAWLLGCSIGSWCCGAYTPRSDASLDQLAGSFLCILHLDSSLVCTGMQVDEPNTNKVSYNNCKFLLTSKYCDKCPVQGHPKVQLWHITFSCIISRRTALSVYQPGYKEKEMIVNEKWHQFNIIHLSIFV